jgi:hypothetical protein
VRTPWIPAAPLAPEAWLEVRRRAIFECLKWDAQVEDVATVADRPLVIDSTAWAAVSADAEALAAELLAAEAEILRRPDLQSIIGIPGPIRRALKDAAPPPVGRDARVIRFDFHFTAEGWRISEANCDVPGGFNEGSGLPPLFAPFYPGLRPAGDPAGSLARAVASRCPPGGTVGLVHATAFTDDRQVMEYLKVRLEALGLRAIPTGPDHIAWEGARARLRREGMDEPLDFLLRFFPAEWLTDLPMRAAWPRFFAGGETPCCNPARSVLCQSKRFPLAWDRMETPLPTWRRLLPESRDPSRAPWKTDPDWIVKPAFGRVGAGIGMQGFTPAAEWKAIRRSVFWRRHRWVAQRRFNCLPLDAGGMMPCLGVYTVDGRAAGAFARLTSRAVIDHLSRDTAVFVADAAPPVEPGDVIPGGSLSALRPQEAAP